MKNSVFCSALRHLLFPVTLAALVVGPGCGHHPATPPAATPPSRPTPGTPPAAVASAEKNSFHEVTAHLDEGGSVYVYLSTEQMLRGLSQSLDGWRDAVLAIPDLKGDDQNNVRMLFDVLAHLVRRSGVEGISGCGMSGIALEKGYYRTKTFVHHYPDQGSGYLWSLLGQKPHAFAPLDWLPENTALCGLFDLDVVGMWEAVREQTEGIAPARQAVDQFAKMAEQVSGSPLPALLGSLAGEHGLFLTLDEQTKVSLPMPDNQTLEFPQPRLGLLFKLKDDVLFQWLCKTIDEKIKPNMEVVSVEEPSLRMRTVAVPLPVPIELRPTLARIGDYLVVATTDRLPRQIVEVQAGKQKSLRSAAEFARMARGLPTEGNSLGYVSQRFGVALQDFQAKAVEQAGRQGAPSALLQKLSGLQRPAAALSVSAQLPDGWLTVGHGNQEPAQALVLSGVVAPAAVVAGMALPALAKGREKAQSVVCMNNLKQIGLAARIYATDHNDKFPSDFMLMKNELSNPRVLICPQAPRQPSANLPLNWENFDESWISYEMVETDLTDASDPETVFVRCPIHGHECRVDGSVRASSSR